MDFKIRRDHGFGSDTGNFSLSISFQRLLEDLSALLEREGIRVIPYKSDTLPNFHALPRNEQLDVVSTVQNYFDVLIEATSREQQIGNLSTVKSMVKKLDLVPPVDFYSLIHDDHIVEVYDRNSKMIFNSAKFFRMVRYTLEEIYTVPWYDLYERDHRITEHYIEFTRMLIEHEITGVVSALIPTHEVRELQSRLHAGKLIQPKYIAPLFDKTGAIAAFVSTFKPI